MYYLGKYSLKKELPDGNIWSGFINVRADRKEDLPTIEEISGTFWFSKDKKGWHGRFKLDNDSYDGNECPYAITFGVYRPDRKLPFNPHTREGADAILDYLQPLEYEEIPRQEAKIQACVTSMYAHYCD